MLPLRMQSVGCTALPSSCSGRQCRRLRLAAPSWSQRSRRCCLLAAIRQAHLQDVEALDQLLTACEAVWTRQQLETEVQREAGRVLLAHTPLGQLVGACMAWLFEGELQVLEVGVAPAHRRQGHARDLLSAMLTRSVQSASRTPAISKAADWLAV